MSAAIAMRRGCAFVAPTFSRHAGEDAGAAVDVCPDAVAVLLVRLEIQVDLQAATSRPGLSASRHGTGSIRAISL